jgi:hypothetical protein
MLIVLFILMIGDYLLTKWGISIGFITEGNGLMSWLMNLPITYGLLVKLALSIILLIPLVIAGKSAKKLQKAALYISFAAYSIVFALHGYWIYIYLTIVV